MSTAVQLTKCAHAPCKCEAVSGSPYCCRYCQDTAERASLDQVPNTQCLCGHPDCWAAQQKPVDVK